MFDALKFCKDYRIDHATSGNKHSRSGWLQVHCPFCAGSQNYHLGINLQFGACNCYRCGKKRLIDVIAKITGQQLSEARAIAAKYGKRQTTRPQHKKRNRGRIRGELKDIALPLGTGPLDKHHRKYLISRNFDPDELEELWQLKGTGPVGPYKFRIIAPIYLDGILVSYQGRDITGKSDLRYKACAKTDETLDHKHTLYGIDLVPNDCAVVVEGITDAWRLGSGAVSTFGTSFTQAQVKLFAKRFKRGFMLFDESDENAMLKAEEFAYHAAALGCEMEVLSGLGWEDPGSATQADADATMRFLGIK